jgi:CRP-like cAMP-binding protein
MQTSDQKAEALGKLREHGREKSYGARQTIFARGDRGDSLAIVESGVVRISVFGADGRELALALLGPGDVIGEISVIDDKDRAADVIAVGRVKVTVISAADARRLIYDSHAVTDFFLELLCDRIRSANAHAESQALNSLAGRLSIFFVNNGEELDDGSLSLPDLPSQSELARLVGGARESVNRQFRIWRDAGLLVPEGQGYLVTDPVRMQEEAVAV